MKYSSNMFCSQIAYSNSELESVSRQYSSASSWRRIHVGREDPYGHPEQYVFLQSISPCVLVRFEFFLNFQGPQYQRYKPRYLILLDQVTIRQIFLRFVARNHGFCDVAHFPVLYFAHVGLICTSILEVEYQSRKTRKTRKLQNQEYSSKSPIIDDKIYEYTFFIYRLLLVT